MSALKSATFTPSFSSERADPSTEGPHSSVLAWEVVNWAARRLELLPPALTRQELLPINASHGISFPRVLLPRRAALVQVFPTCWHVGRSTSHTSSKSVTWSFPAHFPARSSASPGAGSWAVPLPGTRVMEGVSRDASEGCAAA